ncbi:MAG: hypothetical protein HYW50_03840 [Candidatus Diapherotrites archaeon]|nr:hypothetical protein [Candidatus Diapherotrites archaeon]
MKPDFVIISSRLNKAFSRAFEEAGVGSLEYVYFFPSTERRIIEVFAEFGLHLDYKGKNRGVFPNSILWGKEVFVQAGEKTKSGEISIIESTTGEKIGVLGLTFTYDGSMKLVEPPKCEIKLL